MERRKNLRIAAFLWLSAVCAVGGVQAQRVDVYFGEERAVPTGWTQPQIIHRNGATIVQPSIPTGFRKRTFGAGFKGTVRVPKKTPRAPRRKVHRLHIGNGRTLRVREGDTFAYRGKKYRLIGERKNRLVVARVETGRILKLKRHDSDDR